MKKKLLLILGAGSSVEQRIPSTEKLGNEICTEASDWAAQQHSQNFYGLLWCNRKAYHPDPIEEAAKLMAWRTEPNYERVLGDLQMLMNASTEKPWGDPMLQWLAVPETGAGLSKRELMIQIWGQLVALLDKVANRIRDASCVFELELTNGRGRSAFAPYQRIFTELSAEFEIGVYNLNYDTVALNALPDSFVGFNRKTGAFLPHEVLRQEKEWGFLYHLHGSIHHRIRQATSNEGDKDCGPKITWYDDLSQTGDAEEWQNFNPVTMGSDQKRVVSSALIAGGWKLDQLQAEPFLTFYSTLQRHVHEADAILIGGYGFGDTHVNTTLRNMLRSKANGTGRPPILVLDFDKERKSMTQRRDHQASALSEVLHVPQRWFRCPQTRSITQWSEVPAAVPADEFEQSVDRDYPAPVAVWNGGFTAAAEKLPQIIRWLHGERSAL